MSRLHMNIQRLDPRATLPRYATPGAAGADLCALNDGISTTILPGQTVFFRTGLAVAIPEGYVGLIFARSSMGAKRGLAPANKVGVIDSDYRGEICVVLHNHSETAQTVEPGERIAQLLILPVTTAVFLETDTLDDTDRGTGGFGSTGTR